MPESEEPKQVSNNDLRNSQFGSGLINTDNVNAQKSGGNIYNVDLGQQTTASDNAARLQNQKERSPKLGRSPSQNKRDSLEKAYTLQSQKFEQVRNAWVIETDIMQGLWCVTISPNGRVIASCGYSQPINLWNFDTGTILYSLKHQSGGIHYVTFSPDGQILASGGQDQTVKIWHIKTGDLLYTFEHLGAVNCLAFNSNGKILVSGGDDKAIRIWNTSF